MLTSTAFKAHIATFARQKTDMEMEDKKCKTAVRPKEPTDTMPMFDDDG